MAYFLRERPPQVTTISPNKSPTHYSTIQLSDQGTIPFPMPVLDQYPSLSVESINLIKSIFSGYEGGDPREIRFF